MRRRRFLATAGGVAGAGLAGCLALDPAERTHPFAGTTQRVAVEDASTSDLDLTANAGEALEFWAAESEGYAGFPVDFWLVESEPDILIRYADDPAGCEDVAGFDSSRVLGCAPRLGPETAVPDPVVARVVAGGRPYGSVRVTTKHEIGHILGLGHEDDPREIMSNRPEDRIPLYTVRVEIWEAVLSVQAGANEAIRLLNHGTETYRRQAFEAAATAFEAAREDFTALAADLDAALGRTGELEGQETVDLRTVRDRLGHHRERLRLSAALAGALAAAADAAAAGDGAREREAIDEANRQVAAFEDLGPVESSEIAVALGLIRGFDSEASGVPLDEDDVDVG